VEDEVIKMEMESLLAKTKEHQKEEKIKVSLKDFGMEISCYSHFNFTQKIIAFRVTSKQLFFRIFSQDKFFGNN
jgi:hypothetical protein